MHGLALIFGAGGEVEIRYKYRYLIINTGDEGSYVYIPENYSPVRGTPLINPTKPTQKQRRNTAWSFTSPQLTRTPIAPTDTIATMEKLQAQIEKTSEEYQKLQKGVYIPT